MAVVCIHCVVSGLVQGVFYRSNTEKEANKLGLTGWVKNLSNGDVEAVINGDEEKVDAMLEWMYQGPTMARVDNIAVTRVNPEENYSSFSVRY